MNFTDYYKELELDKGASEADIKKAFRRLARQYHPDANPDDPTAEERFKRISEAYEVLSDPQKRAKYDTLSQQRGFPGRGGGSFQFNQEDVGDMFQGTSFGDLLSQLFGQGTGNREQGTGNRRRRTGNDGRRTTDDGRIFSVTLTLEEAFTGVTKRLAMGDRKLDVTFKPGVIHGHRMKIPVGVLEVSIAPHARFTREGNDVRITEHVPLTTALLGGEHSVHTLSGKVTVKIPEGTKNGKTMRLRGMGMPVYEEPTKRGDMFVVLHVDVPTQLTEEQRALVEQLRNLGL
ncbi:MAG: J domain-containing protein [Ignavibacteriae bacterium]|nr:MAG: J domain-containing protein [Ignavibacteriota bacterium]